MERRERLKRIVAERGVPLTSAHGASGQDIVVEVSKNQKELFYTEGTDALMLARKDVAAWSLMQAKNRIGSAKRKREAGEDVMAETAVLHHIVPIHWRIALHVTSCWCRISQFFQLAIMICSALNALKIDFAQRSDWELCKQSSLLMNLTRAQKWCL